MHTFHKKSFSVILYFLFLAPAGILSGCGGGEPAPTEIEKVTKILTSNGGTWAPETSTGVTIDGIDVTNDLFAGFTITFLDNTLTTTGTTPVWLRQDTWKFKDQSAKVMIRGQDNKEVTITEISPSQLKLRLEWTETTTQGGRKYSLKGMHEFLLLK